MDLSWDIVVWTKENTIDYIPFSWANVEKTQYKYPTKISSFKIKKMIDLCSNLDNDFEWLEAKCKAEFVKDLQLAKDMCDRGQFTSNLEETDAGHHGGHVSSKKKRIKKNSFFISISSSSESEDVQKANYRKQTSTFSRDTFETPPQLPTKEYRGNIKDNKTNSNNATSKTIMPAQFCEGESQGCLNRYKTIVNHETESSRASGFDNHQRLMNHEMANTSRPQNGLNLPLTQSATPKATSSTNAANSNDHIIMKELFDVKLGILENKKILERLEAKLGGSNNNLFVELEGTIRLPYETKEEMNILEADLQTNNRKIKDFVSSLYLVGGSTPHKTVYLIINKIFGHLAVMYSGQGKKKKISFCELKVYDAFKAATRKLHPNVSEEDLKKSIGLFLSTAKARLPKTTSDNEQNVQVVDQQKDQDGLDYIY